MAKPVKETPILSGEEARQFEVKMSSAIPTRQAPSGVATRERWEKRRAKRR